VAGAEEEEEDVMKDKIAIVGVKSGSFCGAARQTPKHVTKCDTTWVERWKEGGCAAMRDRSKSLNWK
jgi:uncharacterized damage-inducible protein DinB